MSRREEKRVRIKRFEDIEVSLSSNIQSSIQAYPGWNVATTQFVFSNQHKILVPEMRRDNLNDLHEAAADEANSKDHDGGEKKQRM